MAAIVVVALAVWIIMSVRAPLPGTQYADQGGTHLSEPSQRTIEYNSNPPSSGPHLPPVPRPGVYTTPQIPEGLGHFMEHGGVWLLYDCPEGCEADVKQLERIMESALDRGRPVAVAPYPPMDSKFAAVAWTYVLPLDQMDKSKIEDFVNRHACRYNPEGGPYCVGVRGQVQQGQGMSQTPLPVTQVPPQSVFATPAPIATPPGTPAP